MEGYLESKRRDTGEDANSARVGREAEIPHLKIEPVRIQTSPRIETNCCAQRKSQANVLGLMGPRAVHQPHTLFLVLVLVLVPKPTTNSPSMSSSPSPYNSNAAWSTGHYSRSSPAHPSQQLTGPRSTRGMSAEEEEEDSDENNDTVEDAPEQNRLSQLKGLFLKDRRTVVTSTVSTADCTIFENSARNNLWFWRRCSCPGHSFIDGGNPHRVFERSG